jgi:acyl carrier protein
MYSSKIREILTRHSRLDINFEALDADADLYATGLTSLTTVNIMLAIEDEFDIEFPDSKLNRQTFQSIETLVETVEELLS